MVMRRRFGRRRKTEDRGRPIDESWLARATGTLPLDTLSRRSDTVVPETVALVATGEGEGGTWLVAVSPASAVDALLGALAAAGEVPEAGLAEIVVAAPAWDAAARRLLGSVRGVGGALRAVTLAGEGPAEMPVERGLLAVTPARLADQLPGAQARDGFRAAAAALQGLAEKHDGALRVRGSQLELVIAAQPMAELRAEGERAVLEIRQPSRSVHRVGDERLAEVMDRLEGSIRKRANDRKVRDSEDGLRGTLAGALAAAQGLHSLRRWPLAGAGTEALDAVGVDGRGRAAVLCARERLGLGTLAGILRAAFAIEPAIPVLTADAPPPLRLGERPRLLLTAREVGDGVLAALSRLTVAGEIFQAEAATGPFTALDLETPSPALMPKPERAAPDRARSRGRGDDSAATGEAVDAEESAPRAANGEGAPARRRRRRGGRRQGGDGGASEPSAERAAETPAPASATDETAPAAADAGFEELSMFDLDDDEDDAPRRRRRRRGRRSGSGEGAADESQTAETETAAAASEGSAEGEGRSRRRRGRGRRGGNGEPRTAEAEAAAETPDPDDAVDDEDLLQLSPDAPDLDEAELPTYEDDDGEPESEADRIRLERERRRRARAHAAPALANAADGESAIRAEEETRALPRGRAAILAHADRESITAAVLLAREVRQVEGIWIYPQEDLMTFFRGVATDLRDNTPIYVIGFAAKPARDTLQATNLYRGRLVWFDHHEWPPEDLDELKSQLGEAYTQIRSGGDSSLPVVLAYCTRRSRFSDKLVDLVTGRFTQHDFQRWGRVWWWRLGELTRKTGEQRSELEMLLAGRPSDLAKEASRVELPEPPDEYTWVAGRDFRLVHFGGLAMVAADVPAHLDVHMAMRIARERYGAILSLARVEGGDVFVLGADDVTGKRAVDVGGMVEHLAEKFGWIEALPDEDHVARIRARGAAENPDRFEELIAEIGMGRSILEG